MGVKKEEEREKRRRGKEKEERGTIHKREGITIMHPQRRVPSEARDVAAAEKNWNTGENVLPTLNNYLENLPCR